MPNKIAMPIILSERQYGILTEFSVSKTIGSSVVIRSKIVLMATSGKSNNQIERELKLGKNTVKRWRDRYSIAQEGLKRIENEQSHKLRSALRETLSDTCVS